MHDEIDHLRGRVEQVLEVCRDRETKLWHLQRDVEECRRLKEELECKLSSTRGSIHETIEHLRKHQFLYKVAQN